MILTMLKLPHKAMIKKILYVIFLSVAATGLAACPDMKTAQLAYKKGDHETAVRHWQELADFGIPRAQTSLGRAYLRGQGIEKDEKKAFELFSEAAAQNDVIAVFELARLYEKGIVVKRNAGKAIEYYQNAGDLGYARGYYYMAKMYERGKIIDQDLELAKTHYSDALNLGYDRAKDDLIRLGEDVE